MRSIQSLLKYRNTDIGDDAMRGEPADMERLQRYDSDSSEYPLAIIRDKDKSSQIELDDGRIA